MAETEDRPPESRDERPERLALLFQLHLEGEEIQQVF